MTRIAFLRSIARTLPLCTAISFSACQPSTNAQEAPTSNDAVEVVPAPEARKSPMAVAAYTLPVGTHIKVAYSSPHKRGREIFGGLVPFGEVWRTGANEATEITVTGPVMLAGERVEPGTYAVFTVPGENTWVVILNSVLGQWGSYDYDSVNDVLRFEVPASTSRKVHEAFTISIEEVDGAVEMQLLWDDTAVRIPVASGS